MSIRDKTVLSPSLDYQKLEYSGSTLGFRKTVPISPADFTISPTTISEQFIEINAERVFNFSKSHLVWLQSTDAGGAVGRFNWLYEDSISPIGEVDLTTQSGTKLMQLRWAQNFTQMVRKVMTPFAEYESLSKIHRLYKSNALGTAVSGIRPSNAPGDVHYIENAYLQVGGDNVATTQYCMVPLSAYKHNIVALDKLQFFGETLTLRLGFGPGAKVGYYGTSAANPTTGATALAVDTTISGLSLYLATEEDPELVNKIKEHVNKGGLTMLCPLVTGYRKGFAASTNQISTYTFKQGFQHPKYLQRVYHSVYSATENSNTAYDHSNSTGAKKINSYTTSVKGNKRHQFDLNCADTSRLDYMANQRFLKGTCIVSASIYDQNWMHIDDFTNFPALSEAPSPAPLDNQEAGLRFDPEIEWSFDASTANIASTHYTYTVTLGTLKIHPGATQWL